MKLKVYRHPACREVTGGHNFPWIGGESRMSWTEGIEINDVLWNGLYLTVFGKV